MDRTLARLGILVLLAACEGAQRDSTLAPTPTPSATPTGGLTGSYALSGVVTAAGLPVAGATVALLTFESGALIASTLTDGNGSYHLSEVKNVSPFSGALVSVSKSEYFTETRYVPMTRDETSDVDLLRSSHISVGERIRSRPGDARCASLGYGGRGGTPCQRFALTVPVSGTLEVEVDSTPASPFQRRRDHPEAGWNDRHLRLSAGMAGALDPSSGGRSDISDRRGSPRPPRRPGL